MNQDVSEQIGYIKAKVENIESTLTKFEPIITGLVAFKIKIATIASVISLISSTAIVILTKVLF